MAGVAIARAAVTTDVAEIPSRVGSGRTWASSRLGDGTGRTARQSTSTYAVGQWRHGRRPGDRPGGEPAGRQRASGSAELRRDPVEPLELARADLAHRRAELRM